MKALPTHQAEGAATRFAAALLVLAVVLPACVGGTPTPVEGSALRVGDPFGIEGTRFRIGVEYSNMVTGATNGSEEAVVLEDVRLVGTIGFDRVVTLVDIEAAPRDDGTRLIAYGDFAVDPPARYEGGRCGVQETQELTGYVLEPGKRVAFVIRLRTKAVGAYAFRGQRVEYRQDGTLFHQTVPFELEGVVAETDDMDTEVADQLRCVGGDVRLLPGWRPSS